MIFLAILKYMGLSIVWILAVLLILSAVLVFCPFSYGADVHGADVRASFKWLFGALSFKFGFVNRKSRFDMFVFGIRHKGRDRQPPDGAERNPGKTPDTVKNKTRGERKKPKKENTKTQDAKDGEGRFTRLKKTVGDLSGGRYELKAILSKTLLLMKRLIRAVMPDEFELYGKIGFESPDITGKFIAAESVAAAMTGLSLNIKPDFTQSVFSINLRTAGKTCLFSLIWPLVVYLLSKPVRGLIFNSKKSKENVNEQRT